MSDPAPPPRPVSTGQILREACPTLDLSLPPWENAMAGCFHFEVMVRILAQKHFLGESITRDIGDKNGTEGLLSLMFRTLTFDEKEQRFLRRCNRLRNKLIHCEPDGVLAVLQEIAPDFKPRDVATMIKLPDGANTPGGALVDILRTMRGAVPVQSTSSRVEGFQGWMLEAAGNGTFTVAAAAFVQAVLILDAKADQEIEPAGKPAP